MELASIVLDPNTGEVLALTGGKDYNKSQYNRAISSKRQVGSTMKPFLYYAALENNLTSASKFLSEKTDFVFSNEQIYSPTNYADKYANSDITMAAALAYSDNVYAVKTHLFLGEEVLVNTLNRMGIKEKTNPVPSLALGTSELNMLDFARGYTTLASGGYKRDISFINISSYYVAVILMLKRKNKILENETFSSRNITLILLMATVVTALLFLFWSYKSPMAEIFIPPIP